MKYLFLVSVCCIIGCNQESQNSATPQATLVSTAKAVTEELPTYILLPGITQSVHLVEIQARVEGWLKARHFVEGKIVQEGELLYEIDPAAYEAKMLQAEASLSSAQAQATFAKKELNRNEPLFHSGAIGNMEIQILPITTIKMARHIAKIGRLIKKSGDTLVLF